MLREPVGRNREHTHSTKRKPPKLGGFILWLRGQDANYRRTLYIAEFLSKRIAIDCNMTAIEIYFYKGKYFFQKALTSTHLMCIIIYIKEVDMKKRDLEKLLKQNGWRFLRSGANHDVFTNGKEIEQLPRHREINEQLAKAIIKRRGLK